MNNKREVDLGLWTGCNAACALELEFNRKRWCDFPFPVLCIRSLEVVPFPNIGMEIGISSWLHSEGKASFCSQDRGDLLVRTGHHGLPEQGLQGSNSLLLIKATGRMAFPVIKMGNTTRNQVLC